MEKILNYFKIGLVSLTVLVLLLFIKDVISLDFLLQYSMFLVITLVVVTLGSALFNTLENPKTGVRFAIGLVGLVVFYAIGYGISTDSMDEATNLVIPGSRMAEAGIYTCYFLFFVAGAAIVLSTVKRVFR